MRATLQGAVRSSRAIYSGDNRHDTAALGDRGAGFYKPVARRGQCPRTLFGAASTGGLDRLPSATMEPRPVTGGA